MSGEKINLDCYNELGERWYESQGNPVALLRAESRFRLPWILNKLSTLGQSPSSIHVLDAGCGGGLLANELAKHNYLVTAVDRSVESLNVARSHDVTARVKFMEADLHALPFDSQTFDAVCCMDVLEHLERWDLFIQEAARVLKPGGLLLFYTFNRTLLSYLAVIQALKIFLPQSPQSLHLHQMFIKPRELRQTLERVHLDVIELRGVKPLLNLKRCFDFICGRISHDFAFGFTKSLQVAYLGAARLQS